MCCSTHSPASEHTTQLFCYVGSRARGLSSAPVAATQHPPRSSAGDEVAVVQGKTSGSPSPGRNPCWDTSCKQSTASSPQTHLALTAAPHKLLFTLPPLAMSWRPYPCSIQSPSPHSPFLCRSLRTTKEQAGNPWPPTPLHRNTSLCHHAHTGRKHLLFICALVWERCCSTSQAARVAV